MFFVLLHFVLILHFIHIIEPNSENRRVVQTIQIDKEIAITFAYEINAVHLRVKKNVRGLKAGEFGVARRSLYGSFQSSGNEFPILLSRAISCSVNDAGRAPKKIRVIW